MFRLSFELLPENRILCSNTDRAGVEVALTHHGASHYDQGRGAEAKLICTQHGSDHHVRTYGDGLGLVYHNVNDTTIRRIYSELCNAALTQITKSTGPEFFNKCYGVSSAFVCSLVSGP